MRVVCRELWDVGYGLRVAGCELQVVSYGSRGSRERLQILEISATPFCGSGFQPRWMKLTDFAWNALPFIDLKHTRRI